MKKKFFAGVILFISILSCTAFAEETSIDFNWTMNDTTDVIGYKVYYSNNENMTIEDATWCSDCGLPTSLPSDENPYDSNYIMTCSNIPINPSLYFLIAAVTAEKEIPSDTFTLTIPAEKLPGQPTNLSIIEQ